VVAFSCHSAGVRPGAPASLGVASLRSARRATGRLAARRARIARRSPATRLRRDSGSRAADSGRTDLHFEPLLRNVCHAVSDFPRDRGADRRHQRSGRRRAPRPDPRPRGDGGRVPRRVSRILLDGRIAHRRQARAVPPDGQRGSRARRQGPPLAHGDPGVGVRAGPRAPRRDAASPGRADGRGERGGRGALVGRVDRTRRRRNGGQAALLRRPRLTRPRAAPDQMPRAGVSPDHLRTRVHRAAAPRTTASARSLGEAVAGLAGVCARHRGARAIRPARTVAESARVRVRGCWRSRASRWTRGSSWGERR
jgi:hypothetical protein